jgi:hypothetical protein
VISAANVTSDPDNSALDIHVDVPGDQWRKPQYLSVLRSLARGGLESEPHFKVVINIGGRRRWIVLPDREVEFARYSIIVQFPDDGHWDLIKFSDEEAARRYRKFMEVFQRRTDAMRRQTGLANLMPYLEELTEASLRECE